MTPPRSRLRPLLAAALACVAVVVLFLAGVAAQRVNDPVAATAAAPARAPAPAPVRAPTPAGKVRDGHFEFKVTRVDCSRSTVGPEHLRRTAKGRFCLVSLSVHNIGDGSRYFLGHSQKAFDAAGTAYRHDALAGVYANRDTQTFLEKLDPGERVTGTLVFDVPPRTRLTTLELHDSPFSGGVEVTLR